MINSLYALCDIDMINSNNISIEEYIDKANRANAVLIQYRDKSYNKNQIEKNLEILKNKFNGKIIINDYIEFCDKCDGLHLGQDDILDYHEDISQAVQIVRAKIGRKILGISTHNHHEILEANRCDLDYIGLGSYRSTNTKKVDNIENITYNVIGSGLL